MSATFVDMLADMKQRMMDLERQMNDAQSSIDDSDELYEIIGKLESENKELKQELSKRDTVIRNHRIMTNIQYEFIDTVKRAFINMDTQLEAIRSKDDPTE